MCNENTRGVEREKGTEKMVEATMTENLPKLLSDIKLQIQGAQRTPSRINVPPPTPHLNYIQTSENQR